MEPNKEHLDARALRLKDELATPAMRSIVGGTRVIGNDGLRPSQHERAGAQWR